MIFRTYDHYEKEFEFNDTEICFICFEQDNDTNKLIKLKDQTIFDSVCICNGNIHFKCITKWCSIKQQCPICHRNYKIKSFEPPPEFIDPSVYHLICLYALCFPTLIIDIAALFFIAKIINTCVFSS